MTYKDKFAPPKSWDQFIQDPLGWLQLWDKFQALPLTEDEQPQIVSDIRSFLDVDTLPSLQLHKPTIDSIRFQSLDRVISPKKWLPTIQQVTSKLNTGFPSDHYLVNAKIRVKLGAQIKFLRRKPNVSARIFNQAFQQNIKALRGSVLKATPPSSSQDFPPLPIEERAVHIHMDGSGRKGKGTSTTQADYEIRRSSL